MRTGYLCEGGTHCTHGNDSTHWVEETQSILVQLRRGVYDATAKCMLADMGENRSRKHPHGFIRGVRVMGLWKALRLGFIQHDLTFTVEHVHCQNCTDTVPHLRLRLGDQE